MPRYITTERIFWLCALIALLILLGYCDNRRQTDQRINQERLRLADSLRAAQVQTMREQHTRLYDYSVQLDMHRFQAQQQAKKTDSIDKVARNQSAEIRQLYAELGKPWPVDTVEIASKCCEVARGLADSYDALRVADSLKDGAYLAQIDLATVQVDSLAAALYGSDRRYHILDSLNRAALRMSKPRGRLLVGVSGGYSPGFSFAGPEIGYMGPGGILWKAGVGVTNGGLLWHGGIQKTITLRKRR